MMRSYVSAGMTHAGCVCERNEDAFVARWLEFVEWTPDGHLRHSRFVGLREDMEAHDVFRNSDQSRAER